MSAFVHSFILETGICKFDDADRCTMAHMHQAIAWLKSNEGKLNALEQNGKKYIAAPSDVSDPEANNLLSFKEAVDLLEQAINTEANLEMHQVWTRRFASDMALWFQLTKPSAHYYRNKDIDL